MFDSPYRLTSLIASCGLLCFAALLGINVHAVYTSLPLLGVFFLCVVIGGLGMFWISSRLRDDVQNERWSEETLTPFRQVTGHVLWKIGMGLLVVAMLAALTQDRHQRTWFWAVFFLLQTQTQITNAFARPRKPAGPGARLDWSQISPLRSEHWGER